MSSDLNSRSLTRSRTLPLALVALAIFLVTATSASPNTTRGKPGKPHLSRLPNRYLVLLRNNVRNPGAVAVKQARTYGAQVTHVYRSALKGYAAKIPLNRVAALRANPNVRFVSPDLKVSAAGQTCRGSRRGAGRLLEKARASCLQQCNWPAPARIPLTRDGRLAKMGIGFNALRENPASTSQNQIAFWKRTSLCGPIVSC